MKTELEQVNIALDIIKSCYENDTDMDGKAAVLHPLAVGLKGSNYKEVVTGFLHDIIEDGKYTADLLHLKGFDSDIIDAVMILTRDYNKTYKEYIQSIVDSNNEIAIRVKYEDLFNNLKRNGGKYPSLHKRHFDAFCTLLDERPDIVLK